jgi:hypothetical protein
MSILNNRFSRIKMGIKRNSRLLAGWCPRAFVLVVRLAHYSERSRRVVTSTKTQDS